MQFDLLGNLYFIIILIFSLLILDFWLTLIGQKYYRKYAKKYIKIESYELNPLWKKSIRKGKYDFRHLIGVILLVSGIIYLFYIDRIVYEFVVGGYIIMWSNVLSQHIHNVAFYNFIGNHPNLIKGRIEYKIGLSYFTSMLTNFSIMLIILLILIFNNSIFLLGGFAFTSLFALVSYIWYRKAIIKVK